MSSIDDLLTGANTIEHAQYICGEIRLTLNHGDVLMSIYSENFDHNILDSSREINMKTFLYNIYHASRKFQN